MTITKVDTPVVLSNNLSMLREEISKYVDTVTVEAESGKVCVEGSRATLAHHGPRSGRRCPCLHGNSELEVLRRENRIDVVGISHVDLDTVGGVMSVFGIKPEDTDFAREFWYVAGMVDTEGPHHIESFLYKTRNSTMLRKAFHAYWAFSQSEKGRIFPLRSGQPIDVREEIQDHFDVINSLLQKENLWAEHRDFEFEYPESWSKMSSMKLIQEGEVWAKAQADLDRESFKDDMGSVVLRVSDKFVNHMYDSYESYDPYEGVVNFNPKEKKITISLGNPIGGVSCIEVAQKAWGEGAGGHDGIAGSPRGQEMTFEQAENIAEEFNLAISKTKPKCNFM